MSSVQTFFYYFFPFFLKHSSRYTGGNKTENNERCIKFYALSLWNVHFLRVKFNISIFLFFSLLTFYMRKFIW